MTMSSLLLMLKFTYRTASISRQFFFPGSDCCSYIYDV